MKKLVYFFSLFFSLVSFSQNTRGKANDAGRIVLNTFIDEIEGVPSAAVQMLKTKISQKRF